jgi:hypothetical protein
VMRYVGSSSQGYVFYRSGEVQRVTFHGESINAIGPGLETVAQIPDSTMQEMLSLVPAASGGLSVCQAVPGEGGTISYEARTVDGRGAESKILLAQTGNTKCVNTAPAAALLVAWLYKYVAGPNSIFTRSSTGCYTVADGSNVNDCLKCSDFRLCVQASESERYRTERGPGCRNDNSCACNGGFICGGGVAHCRELESGTLTCVP